MNSESQAFLPSNCSDNSSAENCMMVLSISYGILQLGNQLVRYSHWAWLATGDCVVHNHFVIKQVLCKLLQTSHLNWNHVAKMFFKSSVLRFHIPIERICTQVMLWVPSILSEPKLTKAVVYNRFKS